MAHSMKQSLLFFALLIKGSLALAMVPEPNVEHIKKQIRQLQDEEGITQEEIAHIVTNTLQALLGYPLLYIPAEKYLSLYKTLVEAGADKNVRHPKNGKTALMFAALDGRPDIFKALLALGVDPMVQDNNGSTAALQYPAFDEKTIPEIQCLFEEAEIANSTHKLKHS
ncbi:hypothetical protein BH09DEP1_BH09DEP1_5620 [soil metagenome]